LLKTIAIFIPVVLVLIFFTPIGIAAFVFSYLGLRKPMSWFIYKIGQCWAFITIKFSGCTLTVTGRDKIPQKGGICIVSNHGSIFDIVLQFAYIGRPIAFIAKKELAYIPFLNMWISVLGGLFIDRKNNRSAVRTIKKGIARIKSGSAMIIFPEGHRSRGQGLLPFHPGSLKLATQAVAPIVPMAIGGSYEVFEKTGRLQSCPISVSFGDPVLTSELPQADRKQILSDKIYGIISQMLEN
jgi:1-acyl-sn-glycerol-3-phosphate acyltransferase